jgi:hypothetical protein
MVEKYQERLSQQRLGTFQANHTRRQPTVQSDKQPI